MKLLLIQPPIQDFYDTNIRLQPIGLAYLKSAVKKYLPHITVKIIDFHHGFGKRTLPLPPDLTYLKEYYVHEDKSPFCTFHHYYHFGALFDQIAKMVLAEKPDLVGISSLFSPYYREVLETARAIKKVLSVPIVVGGSHASVAPQSLLQDPHIDFVIKGEGERALVEFLQTTDWSTVSQLGYKDKNGSLIFNPPQENFLIQELGIPDLSDFPVGAYSYYGKPMAVAVTSRGCPHRCSFCSVHATFGYQHRERSVVDILQEIKTRYDQGYRVIDFEDDNLTFNQTHFKELCQGLIALFPLCDMEFVAMNGVSYMSLDDDMLALMRRAGFLSLNLSLVTANQHLQESTQRRHSLEKYKQVVMLAAQLGFKILSSQILGLPGESLESQIQTLCLQAIQPVLIGASPFYSSLSAWHHVSSRAERLPAEALAQVGGDLLKLKDDKEMATEPGLLAMTKTDDSCSLFLSRLTALAHETKECSRDDLFTLFVCTRILNFLKSLTHDRVLTSSVISLLLSQQNLSKYPERTRVGLEILQKLQKEGVLYAWTDQGLTPIKKFKAEIFHQILKQL